MEENRAVKRYSDHVIKGRDFAHRYDGTNPDAHSHSLPNEPALSVELMDMYWCQGPARNLARCYNDYMALCDSEKIVPMDWDDFKEMYRVWKWEERIADRVSIQIERAEAKLAAEHIEAQSDYLKVHKQFVADAQKVYNGLMAGAIKITSTIVRKLDGGEMEEYTVAAAANVLKTIHPIIQEMRNFVEEERNNVIVENLTKDKLDNLLKEANALDGFYKEAEQRLGEF